MDKISKFKEKKHFIGVDISKDSLDLGLLNANNHSNIQDLKVNNSIKGFSKILEWLNQKNIALKDCMFCMEHTGNYGLLFFAWLSKNAIDYCVEPALQIKRSMGIQRGKNDQVDARRIAEYAYTHKERLKPFQMPSTLNLQIKQLLTYREQLVRIRSSLKNSLKSHQQYIEVGGLKEVRKKIEKQIKNYEQEVAILENKIIELINKDTSFKKNFEFLRSIKGIGLITGAYTIVITHNFTAFINSRKFASYTGIAPFENSSGKYIGKSRISNLGNKIIKKLLTNGARSACQWDPEIKAYFQRKLKEGKKEKVVINAIRYKLVNRMFAVIKRQSPFVDLYQHKFC